MNADPGHPVPGDGSAPCPICKDKGYIAKIETNNGAFFVYCKCPAGQPLNPPPLPPTPPTDDLIRE